MKLRVSCETIRAAVAPQTFAPVDVLSIMPRLKVGDFESCVLTLPGAKIVVITNGIVMAYSNIENFFSGFDPLSLVKDDTVYYDQGGSCIDFKIESKGNPQVDNEEFSKIYELMFGAREANDLMLGQLAQVEPENSDTEDA